jgi:hypothetical protein
MTRQSTVYFYPDKIGGHRDRANGAYYYTEAYEMLTRVNIFIRGGHVSGIREKNN